MLVVEVMPFLVKMLEIMVLINACMIIYNNSHIHDLYNGQRLRFSIFLLGTQLVLDVSLI